jgi:hypothetical protein
MMKQWKEILELKGDVGCTSLVTRIAKNLGLLENAYVAYIDDIPRWYIGYEYFVHAHMLKKNNEGKLVIVTPRCERAYGCVSHVCQDLKLHTCNDIINCTKHSVRIIKRK